MRFQNGSISSSVVHRAPLKSYIFEESLTEYSFPQKLHDQTCMHAAVGLIEFAVSRTLA